MPSLASMLRSSNSNYKHHTNKARSYFTSNNDNKANYHLVQAEIARNKLAKRGKVPRGGKTKKRMHKKRKTKKRSA